MRRVLILGLMALVLVAPLPAQAQGGPEAAIRDAVHSFRYDEVLKLAMEIASQGPRAPGYPGYERVFEMIVNEAKRLNLTVEIQNFTMLAPVETESFVEVLEPVEVKFKAYSLWPHGGIEAGSGVFDGLAIYVGKGKLDEFNDKPVNGSIVLMDYEGSGKNWLNALRFGAKAVVYLGTNTAEWEALTKFDPLIPMPFMRLYLTLDNASRLRDLMGLGRLKLRVYTDMRIREVTGHNILVKIPGLEKPDEIMMFVAHYDSWCVAPGLANSTEEALAPATLIELMRYLASHRPLRTAWLLFTSGHWNGLVGPREFVRNYILTRPDLVRGRRIIWYVMGLDISADLPVTSLVYVGHFYAAGRTFMTTKFYWLQGRVSTVYSRVVGEYLNETGLPESEGLKAVIRDLGLIRFQDLTHGPEFAWSGTMSHPYILDTEPFVMAGMAAFTLRTSLSYRPREGEPVSDLEYVVSRFRDRIVPQLASAVAIAVGLLNEPDIGVMRSLIMPTRLHPLLYWGFIDLEVRVLEYNVSRGWYDPVPHAIVRVCGGANDYPFTWMFVKADSKGIAVVHGITPQGINTWLVEAFKPVNESWMYVPAYGMHSTGPAWVNALVPRVYATVNVKLMKVHVLLDLYYPRLMRRCAIEDPRFRARNIWAWTNIVVTPYHTETGMIPLYYGTLIYVLQNEAGLLASIPVPRMTFTISYIERWPLGVVEGDKPVFTAFDYARSLYRLAYNRYSVLSFREVRKLSADLMLQYSREHLEAAEKALGERRYGDAYRNALAAWSYAARAYADEVMPLYEESVKSAIVFVPFVVISAYFFERLLLRGEGLKRIAYIAVLEVLMFLVFAMIHPAFWIIPSTLLAAMCVGLLILMAVVLWIFYREARDIVAEFASKILGYHEVVRERMAATIMAISLSTENMRKRPLRTILTIVPVTVFAMALISLASISPYTAVLPSPIEKGKAPYYGMAIKRAFSVLSDVLDYPTVEEVRAIVGDKGLVCPRIWYYPAFVYPRGPYGLLISHNATARVTAFLGLTPEEAAIVLSKGIARGGPFLYEDQMAIILPSSLAEALGVDVGDEVEFRGMRFIVTGILSETAMEAVTDFRLSFAPMDPIYFGLIYGYTIPMGLLVPQPLAWSRVAIIPSGIARKIGGYVASIGVILRPDVSHEEAVELAKRIAYAVDAVCYFGRGNEVYGYSRFPTYAAIGWEMMIIPFAITALSIVTSLLGSVKEREREIFTYSSVGLSPGGAMLMFIVEFAVYGFIGATLGYFLGWGVSKVLRALRVLPPTFIFNYASISISLVMVLVLLSTLAASTYPSYIAAKIITPSLERRWRVPRAPRGTVWDIPLPFRVPSEREAQALLLYLEEYYLGAGYEKRFHKVSIEPKVDVVNKRLRMAVRLYPFDTGTEQEVNLYFVKERLGGWRAAVSLRLLRGHGGVWTGPSQYNFLDDLRKQMLLWGTLPSDERERYLRRVRDLILKSEVRDESSSHEG